METGNNGGELYTRRSSKIEIIGPIAQRKAARSLAQSEEETRKLWARARGDDDVFPVPVQLKIDIGCRYRLLTQWQPHIVLQCHAKQQFRGWRRGGSASPSRGWRSTRLLRVGPTGSK